MPSGDRSRSRRTPLVWAGVLTGLLLAGGAFPIAPLRDARTGVAVTDGRLRLSPAYVVLAPVNNTLDALSLLSVREHVATLVAVVVLYVLWRIARRAQPVGEAAASKSRIGWARETVAAGGALATVVAVYATGALVPRPMAALALSPADSDLVRIDFHSHTNASHDGRPGFTPARNRAWHRAAGFDAAYVSDHFTLAGAEAASRENPRRSGDGTVLLSGIECLEGGQHVIVLGVSAADSAWIRSRDIAADAVTAAVSAGRPPPVIVQTIPGQLDRVPRAGMPNVVPVRAIELSDAAPRGLSAGDRDRDRILRLADSLDLALVAGSDNHGWGRTAAAWTVMALPGWRALAPDDLGRRVEHAIQVDGQRAARVVERTRPVWPATGPAAGGAAPTALATLGQAARFLAQFTWQLVAMRSWAERVSWIAWIWLAAAALWWWRRQP